MNIIQRALRGVLGNPVNDMHIMANGQLADKRDVEDPTGKFQGTRYINQSQSISKVRKNVMFLRPEYDFPTISNAVTMDGILSRAVNIFSEQILKNGYEFISKNQRLQRHITKRMKEMENLTGVPFYEVMNAIALQLVTYGNCYIVKVRSRTKSRFGKPYFLYGREYDPVVGLFIADASTIHFGVNDAGQVVNYKQFIRGKSTYWDEREVIHIAYNRIPGTLAGQSQFYPVLDDVRALRKLEEELEILGYQYSIPLFLYKVGNKEQPAAPGEIDQAIATINNMPAYGMLVVPGNHTIEVPSNNNTPVDLISFCNHFKSRIYAGLGVSPVAMGESDTSNRSTSQVLDTSMQTTTKRYQQIIKTRLELDLFREIMLDGGFDPNMEDADFSFSEIDLEAQIKKETNIIAKWQNNMITREEARNELDYETKIHDEDTFLRLIDIPKIEAQKAIMLQIAKMKGKEKSASGVGTGGGGGEKAGGTQGLPKPPAGGHSVTKVTHKIIGAPKATKATNTKVAPENQHGKSTGRPKFTKDSIETLITDSTSKINIYLQDNGGASVLNTNKLSEKLVAGARQTLRDYTQDMIKSLCDYNHLVVPPLNGDVSRYLDEVELLLKDKVSRSASKLDDDVKVNVFADEVKDFLNLQKEKSENLARLLVYKSLGYMTILVNADDCNLHAPTQVALSDIKYIQIPPFKYNCKCNISEKGIYDFNDELAEVDLSQN